MTISTAEGGWKLHCLYQGALNRIPPSLHSWEPAQLLSSFGPWHWDWPEALGLWDTLPSMGIPSTRLSDRVPSRRVRESARWEVGHWLVIILSSYTTSDLNSDHKLPMRPGSGPAPKNLPFNTNVSNFKSRYLGDEKKLFKIFWNKKCTQAQNAKSARILCSSK